MIRKACAKPGLTVRCTQNQGIAGFRTTMERICLVGVEADACFV
jgi:hypothetical protein